MNTLSLTLEELIKQTGFDKLSDFALSKEIVYKEEGKPFLHTFNYLDQKFNELTYLEINSICEAFNTEFWDAKESELTPDYWGWLIQNRFGHYSQNTLLQPFNNLMLEIDFFPEIKGYYIMDKEDNYYMLISFAKYNSSEFTGLKLLKYTSPYFSFPMQSNYIKE